MALAAAAPDGAARRVDGMSGAGTDPQAAILAAFARSGRPVPEQVSEALSERQATMNLMAEAFRNSAAIAADPTAFAARAEAATGHAMTAEELQEMQAWAASRAAAAAAASAAVSVASAGPPASASAYITAARAIAFHTPLGFGTFLESYARRNGWIQGFSIVSRWKWRGLAVLEIAFGLFVAAIGRIGSDMMNGIGLGIAAGGVATWIIAASMARRTREGAVVKAQLAAYRRTLKATFAAAATLDGAVGAAGLTWLETPDQALVWGVALGPPIRHRGAPRPDDERHRRRDGRTRCVPAGVGRSDRSGARCSGRARFTGNTPARRLRRGVRRYRADRLTERGGHPGVAAALTGRDPRHPARRASSAMCSESWSTAMPRRAATSSRP